MPPSLATPTAAHETLMADLAKVIGMVKHKKLTTWEKLAIVAHLAGQLSIVEDIAKKAPAESEALIIANVRGGRKGMADQILSIQSSIQL